MPHEDTDIEEVEDKKIPDTKDMESDDGGSSLGGVSKEKLKAAMREVQMEDRLKYTVDCRDKEELQMIIKMAEKKISELEKNPKGGKSSPELSKY